MEQMKTQLIAPEHPLSAPTNNSGRNFVWVVALFVPLMGTTSAEKFSFEFMSLDHGYNLKMQVSLYFYIYR